MGRSVIERGTFVRWVVVGTAGRLDRSSPRRDPTVLARLIRAFAAGASVAVLALVALVPGSLAASPRLLGIGVPLASNDSYGTPAQTTLVVPAPGVLANDTDLLGTNLTAQLKTKTSHGNLTLSANGGFTYQPDGGFSGVDTFTYQAVDGLPSLCRDRFDHRRASPVHAARPDPDSDPNADPDADPDTRADPDANTDPDLNPDAP